MLKRSIFVLLLTISSLFAFSVNMENSPYKCDQILENMAYTTCYNYETLTPIFTYYKLDKYHINKYLKRYRKFLVDKRVPKKYRVDPDDYKHSGYDRGHLCPNAVTDWNIKAQKETFYMTNIAPQSPKHNRYGWKDLEIIVRKIVNRYNDAEVVTGVYYENIDNKINDKIAIPQYWYKVVYVPSINRGFAIITPNKPLRKSQLKRYLLPIKDLEEIVGIEFFTDKNKIAQHAFKRNIDRRLKSFFN